MADTLNGPASAHVEVFERTITSSFRRDGRGFVGHEQRVERERRDDEGHELRVERKMLDDEELSTRRERDLKTGTESEPNVEFKGKGTADEFESRWRERAKIHAQPALDDKSRAATKPAALK